MYNLMIKSPTELYITTILNNLICVFVYVCVLTVKLIGWLKSAQWHVINWMDKLQGK